jgi:predicted O-methyltransferase YrrM
MTPHIMIIQAVYTDARLSKRRLEISQHTLRPSLAYQTRKPAIHLAQHPADPHAGARADMLRSTGCDVREVWRDRWRLYGENYDLPAGRKVVSRCDDDDVLAVDFCERTYGAAPQTGEHALIWPVGMTYWRNRAYSWEHTGNQFVSIVTEQDVSPHQMQHHKFSQQWHTIVVSREVGWIWIRHGDAHTPTLSRYRPRPLNRIDVARTPINMRAIDRAMVASGSSAATYAAHKRRKPAQSQPATFSEALEREGSDKTTIHSYGEFYNALIKDLQPRKVLEIGVFRGASIRAWRHLPDPVEVVGIDRNACPGIPVIRCTAPDFSPALEQLHGQQFDLIIDDGSHRLPHQLAAIEQLSPLVRPGGLFVVEDLQNDAATTAVQAAFSEDWQITVHDWRQQSGRWDDVIVTGRKPAGH